MKETIKRIPGVRQLAKALAHGFIGKLLPFKGSESYWQTRYSRGGNSGPGSYSKLAQFKAEVLNAFVKEKKVDSVLEWGCGDGNQLRLAEYPAYLGIDVSEDAVRLCQATFTGDPSKKFLTSNNYRGERAELVTSLDVIYHLIEEQVFDAYMKAMFASASRFVVIYASNTDEQQTAQPKHVRHRKFTDWIDAHEPGWRLLRQLPNRYPYRSDWEEGSFADFYFFAKSES